MGKRILIASNRKLAHFKDVIELEISDCEVTHSITPQDAFSAAEAGETDIIVLELCANTSSLSRLREINPNQKVIVITNAILAQHCKKHEPLRIFVMPLGLEELIQCVKDNTRGGEN